MIQIFFFKVPIVHLAQNGHYNMSVQQELTITGLEQMTSLIVSPVQVCINIEFSPSEADGQKFKNEI